MAESEQIWWAYVKLENRAEIYSARIYSKKHYIDIVDKGRTYITLPF